jgi:hypothetical protein
LEASITALLPEYTTLPEASGMRACADSGVCASGTAASSMVTAAAVRRKKGLVRFRGKKVPHNMLTQDQSGSQHRPKGIRLKK